MHIHLIKALGLAIVVTLLFFLGGVNQVYAEVVEHRDVTVVLRAMQDDKHRSMEDEAMDLTIGLSTGGGNEFRPFRPTSCINPPNGEIGVVLCTIRSVILPIPPFSVTAKVLETKKFRVIKVNVEGRTPTHTTSHFWEEDSRSY